MAKSGVSAQHKPYQIRALLLLNWLKARRDQIGCIPSFTNQDAQRAMELDDPKRFGKVAGNIQSQIDLACYFAGLPPLGLTANRPYLGAWRSTIPGWDFPVSEMQSAAQNRIWKDEDFTVVATEASRLPGNVAENWRREMANREASVRGWADRITGKSNSSNPVDPVLLADVAALEGRFLNASPAVKKRMSKVIERGPAGEWAKRQNGYECQICRALGQPPVGFDMQNGGRYVEAHHVVPVSRGEIGSLALSNIMTVCATHHRQLHFGKVEVAIECKTFAVQIDGYCLNVARLGDA